MRTMRFHAVCGRQPPRPDIPERYREAVTSPLKAEVVAGKDNVIDLKLD